MSDVYAWQPTFTRGARAVPYAMHGAYAVTDNHTWYTV